MLDARNRTTRLVGFTVVVLIVWLLLPVLAPRPLREIFFEFQAPAWTALSYLQDLQNFWNLQRHSKAQLIESGRDLARLNSAYELMVQENWSLRAEIRRLESLLELPPVEQHKTVVARVVQRHLNAWWQQLVIRKGRANGLAPGQAVVFAGGVVGRVKEVHWYTAVVELCTSPNFRMAAHFEGDQRPVVYRGGYSTLLSDPYGQVSNVPLDFHPTREQPLRLVASRLGGIFPDGLTIGWVESLTIGSDGLFQTGHVRLDPRLLSLMEVAVLVPQSAP